MIKDIREKNENVKPNSREIEVLKTKTSHTLNGIRTLKIQQYRQLNSKLSHGS